MISRDFTQNKFSIRHFQILFSTTSSSLMHTNCALLSPLCSSCSFSVSLEKECLLLSPWACTCFGSPILPCSIPSSNCPSFFGVNLCLRAGDSLDPHLILPGGIGVSFWVAPSNLYGVDSWVRFFGGCGCFRVRREGCSFAEFCLRGVRRFDFVCE